MQNNQNNQLNQVSNRQPQQKFIWVAVLKDGALITEYNSDGSENSYKDLPREKITHFGLVQGQKSGYFIELKTGIFHLKDYRLNKSVNITLPIGKKGIEICDASSFHPFHHFKEAHQDFNLAGQKHGGTVIDRFLLGWSTWKNIPSIGRRFIETTLYIDNIEAPKPTLNVFLRKEPNTSPVDGSPYNISL